MPSYALDAVALRSARHAKGWTQTQLSDAVAVARADRVSAWELGQATPHPHQLRSLATALNVPITSLLQPVPEERRDLRRLRIEAGLSAVELADQIHVALPTLKRWEGGGVRGLASRAPVDALAGALGIGAAEVYGALQRTTRH